MIAFLPVARYRVEFQVAAGRPFSSFERLLLKAINQGHGTLDSLTDIFRLHRRMVIEGVVTLMQAGWVCLGTESSSFVTTAAGRLACKENSDLPSTIVVSNRSTTLLLEKVSGQLARSSDVDLYTRQKLDRLWAAGVPIPPSDVSNMIEPGMITHLLPREPGEWIRLVGPVTVVTDNRLYAIVDVDVSKQKLTGIPQAWHALLAGELVGRVSRAEARLAALSGTDEEKELKLMVERAAGAKEDVGRETAWHPAKVAFDDILITPEEHRGALTTALTEARSFVVIVSAHLSGVAVDDVVKDLGAALERDLLIAVLWGGILEGAESEHTRGLELLKKIEYDSNHGKYRGRLMVNTAPLGCSFNALASDQLKGSPAAFGSLSWLGSPGGEERHLSVRFTCPPIAARLFDCVADLASKDERIRTSSAVTSLRKGASALRSLEVIGDGPIENAGKPSQLNLFFGETVSWYCDEVITGSKESVRILADRANAGVWPQLKNWLSPVAVQIPGGVKVLVGDVGKEIFESGHQGSALAPVELCHSPGIRANALVVDGDTTIVKDRSVFVDVAKRRGRGYEVALAITNSGIGRELCDRLGIGETPLAE